MYKKDMIISTLEDIIFSLELILKRTIDINTIDDFLNDDIGLEKLDSVAMRLVAIGEGLKNIDKLDDKLLYQYPEIPRKQVKGIRDILSHHYFNLDAEIIYNICQYEISKILYTTNKILDDLKK